MPPLFLRHGAQIAPDRFAPTFFRIDPVVRIVPEQHAEAPPYGLSGDRIVAGHRFVRSVNESPDRGVQFPPMKFIFDEIAYLLSRPPVLTLCDAELQQLR